MRRRAAPTWPGTKAWTCAGVDRNEATRAPAKNIDMDVKRTEPTRRSGLKDADAETQHWVAGDVLYEAWCRFWK